MVRKHFFSARCNNIDIASGSSDDCSKCTQSNTVCDCSLIVRKDWVRWEPVTSSQKHSKVPYITYPGEQSQKRGMPFKFFIPVKGSLRKASRHLPILSEITKTVIIIAVVTIPLGVKVLLCVINVPTRTAERD